MAAVALLAVPAVLSGQARPGTPPLARIQADVQAELSGPRARETVAFVEQFFRLPGNAGFDASLDRVVAILREAGFVPEAGAAAGARLVYRIEERPLARPAWEPVDAELVLVGDSVPVLRFATNRNMIAINSWPTPPGGIEAELAWVGSGRPEELDRLDLRGKVVAGDVAAGRLHAAARQRGALGVLGHALPAYTRPEWNRHSITFGSIPWDSAGTAWALHLSRAARDRLEAAARSGTARVRVRIETRRSSSPERTLVAEVRGSRAPAERFVFSAHVQEPGANDNASGVGLQAEIARTLAALVRSGRQDPARTVTFLWGDEIRSTRRFLQDDSTRLRGVRWGLSLDMVGENTDRTGGTFLIEKMPDPSAVWTRGDDRHSEWGGAPLAPDRIRPHWFNDWALNRCLDHAAGGAWVVRTNPFEGGSDHTPFLDAGKPGLLFWHFTDQFYHTDRDRLENVSATTLGRVGNCALVTALGLVAPDPALVLFMVAEVSRAARERLAAEAWLSRAALVAGGPADREAAIRQAWVDYYVGALRALAEVEVGGASPPVAAAIEAAARAVAGGR